MLSQAPTAIARRLSAAATLRCRPLVVVPPRWCSSQSGQRPSPQLVTERSISDVVDLLILPLRHTIYSVNLWTLSLVFPGAWKSVDFFEGAPQAFRHIAANLDMEDRDARP